MGRALKQWKSTGKPEQKKEASKRVLKNQSLKTVSLKVNSSVDSKWKKKYPQCHIVDHPLAQQKLSELKEEGISSQEFRQRLEEISFLLVYEAMRKSENGKATNSKSKNLKQTDSILSLASPKESSISKITSKKNRINSTKKGAKFKSFQDSQIVFVPVMRAGLGMMTGLTHWFPKAQVGHIGIYRDKFINNTVEYYFRLPEESPNREVYILDPMLATGATIVATVSRLKECGVDKITIISLMTCTIGLDLLSAHYPEIPLWTVAISEKLDSNGFLVDGLGDVGYRLFGT